jgi:voltage-gated potassium channel Kch
MLMNFTVAAILIGVTVAIQAGFMSAGLTIFDRLEAGRNALIAKPTVVIVVWILYLMIPVIIDVFVWAAFYSMVAALPSFEDSLYFSTVTFTTVGYGDIVLSREWRQLSTFEAINGWIIFGWMTALIMAAVQRLHVRSDAPRSSGRG